MKVLYLHLKNFSTIYTGLDAKEIKIDFSIAKNKIILLEGPNGIGKTSILSTIHPFANNGSFDSRSEVSLILQGEEGYKEIHIDSDNDLYVIKHHYYPSKESHTVKSYIEKNGVELNTNGNVTSFKDIVKTELDLEIDYLKLIRLGSNVKGFIDLKSTERKAFMSKILSDVDIYLKLYKKISKDITALKTILSHNTDKIKKLNIDDIEMVNKEIEVSRDMIKSLNRDLTKLNEKKAVLTHELSKLPDKATIDSDLDVVYKDYKHKKKLLEKINIDNIDEILNELQTNVKDYKQKSEILSEKIALYKNQLDDIITNKKTLMIELDKELSKQDVSSLEKIIKELQSFISKSDVIFRDFNPEYTKDDLEKVMSVIFSNQRILDITYEFGEKPVKKVIKLMKNQHNVQEFVSNKLNTISNNKLSVNSNYILDKLAKKFPIIYPECNNSSCVVYKFWKEFKALTEQKYLDKDIESEEFYNFMSLAYSNIKNVFLVFGDNKSLFEKMPVEIQEMFKLNNIYDNISKLQLIYDRDILYDNLTKITEYQNYLDKKEELKKYTEELELKKNTSNKTILVTQLETINNQMKDLSDKITNYTKEYVDISNELSRLNDDLENTQVAKNYLDEKSELEKKLNELVKQQNSFDDLSNDLNKIKTEIALKELELNKHDKNITSLQYRCNEYNTLMTELNKLKDEFDDMVTIKDSISSKEGIPLVYINIYLRKTKDITNELLDIAYNGKLYIKSLKAKEDSFPIPYYKKNKLIKDISLASQGERSIASLALSFALSSQNLSKYNIMLLDEIDSTLDESNRKKFIKILEKLMDIVNAEQVFLISHNGMFDMYPVTILNFLNKETKKNNIIDYIKIQKIA